MCHSIPRPRRAAAMFRRGGFRLLLCALACGGQAWAHGVIRYDNGLWFDGTSFQARTVYSVEGRLAFRHEGEVDRVLDLGAGYVIPPFGDAHSHALAGPNFAEEQQGFLAVGTFYVANPNCISDWAREARVKAAAPETVDVRYAMGGLTSSGGHPIQIYDGVADQVEAWSRQSMDGRAYFAVDDAADLERQWPRLLATEPDLVKVYLERAEHHAERRGNPAFYGKRALDPALLPPIVDRAHARGLRVSAHVTSAFDFVTAVRAGVDEIAHLPLEPLDDEAAAEAAKRGTTVVTTTLSHRPAEGIDLDAVHGHNLKLLRRHGVRLVLGTDSHRTILDEARNVARLAGLTPVQTLDLLTRATPRWIFPGREIGVLAPGYEASFLVLDADALQDLGALSQIRARVKSGHSLNVEVAAALPPVAGPLMHKTMTESVDAAIAEYRRLRREEPDAWDLGEQQLNGLGYALLNHGRPDDAIAIFGLNVEMFPASANTYDSLGEAYLKRGDRERARENYRRSLELNPHNQGARDKLRELEAP